MATDLKDIINFKDNESTAYPWWVIVDQGKRGTLSYAPNVITGPFFSRETAEKHLQNRRYAYTKSAHVYCMSGHWSQGYKQLLDLAEMNEVCDVYAGDK